MRESRNEDSLFIIFKLTNILKEVFFIQELQIALPENLEDIKLPSPELVNYWRLSENRIFYIDYEIDESVLEIQRSIIAINIADKDISPKDRLPIKIYLDYERF